MAKRWLARVSVALLLDSEADIHMMGCAPTPFEEPRV
jgi:hypothetical protein